MSQYVLCACLFTSAAKAELPDAQAAVGEMLLNGRGGARSVVGARQRPVRSALGDPTCRLKKWFRAAAECGHDYAQIMLGRYLMDGTPATLIQRKDARGSS